ncbi:hypothetical protein [Pseudoalteromonas sp. OF7H-1]|uniref:Cas10/Cmr2 second palm domain-containing protein n=1 Tax=Pseudoalteromonas sp. OF7H-1 TaxID=2917755 RepID=UPI001EF58B32|nr:hypothetical protein [Pseudoalteromonas sp. OF7H-1]MCG7542210.1 hypothetical protein [Pseudoalteromonas sp. OF7H-1]
MFVAQIEFKRIQTFLFSSSRLHDMVAANALLAKTIRYDLVVAAIAIEKAILPDKTLLCGNDSDALAELGILSRDGGHFYALFSSCSNAKRFIAEARTILINNLAGLTVHTRIFNEACGADDVPFETMTLPSLTPLTLFKKCEQSNIGVAEQKSKRTQDLEKKIKISQQTALKNNYYKQLTTYKKAPDEDQNIEATQEDTQANEDRIVADFASAISTDFVSQGYTLPTSFDKLVDDDYLAVISADGNNMGQRFIAHRNKKEETQSGTFSDKQRIAEAFFGSAREQLKSAVKQGIIATFKHLPLKSTMPFQVLMLGGDDLLLVCQAKYAFELVKHIDSYLSSTPIADNKPLTMSFGVCIASHNLPFYRLHYAAEKLNASAKVKARGTPDTEVQPSCVDWQIVTQAWLDNPINARKQQQIKVTKINDSTETLLLSQKPYLLGEHKEFNDIMSLAAQFLPASHQDATLPLGDPTAAEEAQHHIMSRAHVYQLMHTLPLGWRQTELLINKMIARDKQHAELKVTDDNDSASPAPNTLCALFQALAKVDSNKAGYAFYPLQGASNYYTTKLGDVLELVSLQYLSREKEVS